MKLPFLLLLGSAAGLHFRQAHRSPPVAPSPSSPAPPVRPQHEAPARSANDAAEEYTELEERRLDEDGGAYTYEEFLRFYGEDDGRAMWLVAEEAPEEVSLAVQAVRGDAEASKQSALSRLTAEEVGVREDLGAPLGGQARGAGRRQRDGGAREDGA